MQNLEPPEVPLELLPEIKIPEQKKDGFLKKLFSRKSDSDSNKIPTSSDTSNNTLPTLDLSENTSLNDANTNFSNINLDGLNNSSLSNNITNFELPADINNIDKDINASIDSAFAQLPATDNSINAQLINSNKKIPKGKSHGKLKKGTARKVKHIDESSQFDWTREVKDQEILIHDSNRFNQDVNILITETDKYLDNANTINNDNSAFISQHQEVSLPKTEVIVPEFKPLVKPMPANTISDDVLESTFYNNENADFLKVSMSHKKLRTTLEQYIRNAKLFNNKQKVMALFKQYDLGVEKVIEDKELALTQRKKDLDRFELHLKDQEKDIKSVHSYIMKLDSKLKDSEKKLNTVISTTVEKELARRLKIEKKQLSDELKKTALLNNELKKKIKLIDEDNIRFKKEHERISEMERQKLTQMQTMYEQKLNELNMERGDFESKKKAFEEKRKQAMNLMSRADNVAKELSEIDRMKTDIEYSKKDIDSSRADIELNKNIIEKEYNEDKELKRAIESAEMALAKEKDNLDNLIFSKYLDNKLKSIKPEYLEKQDDWRAELKSHPLYGQIFLCRKTLAKNNIAEAKSMYNSIRKSYDLIDVSTKEKEALYTAIRELYNDIQLKIVELQMNS